MKKARKPLDPAELVAAAKGDAGLLGWLYHNFQPGTRKQKGSHWAPAALMSRWDRPPRFEFDDIPTALRFWKSYVADYFENCHARFKAGDRDALMDAVSHAANWEVPIPDWAAVEFSKSWERYKNVVPDPGGPASQSTLGGAFRITRPDNFSAPAARFLQAIGTVIRYALMHRTALKEKPTVATFKAVAEGLDLPRLQACYVERFEIPESQAADLWDKRLGARISHSTVKNLYYTADEWVDTHAVIFYLAQPKEKDLGPKSRCFPNLTPNKRK